MNKIPKEYETNSVEHRFGGNGWAVVQPLPDNCCRIANFFQDREGRWKIGNQLFVAWNKMLKLEPEFKRDQHNNLVATGDYLKLPQEIMDAIGGIRDSLASGKFTVQNTRLVKATP